MSPDESPFGRRALALLIGAGIVLALGFLLLSGFGNDLVERGRVPPPQSNAATGFRALFRLIEMTPGGTATLIRDPAQIPLTPGGDGNVPPTDPNGLLVVTPGFRARPADIEALLRARQGAPTLIVLPKWVTDSGTFRRSREQRLFPQQGTQVRRILPARLGIAVATGGPAPARIKAGPGWGAADDIASFPSPPFLQTISGGGLASLLHTERGDILLGRLPQSEIYILSDPDLLDNFGLAAPAAAQRALDLLTSINLPQPGRIAFDLSLHYRPGDRNLIKLMFEPPFLAVTIALAAAAALAGFASAIRFGPVRREADAIAPGKRALADNIAALTRLAGRTAFAGPTYAEAMREWIARRLRVPRSLRGAALADYLDALRPERPFTPIEARLHAARNEAELLQAAQELDDWRKEVIA